MRYTHRRYAERALKRISKKRVTREKGELVSPAEAELLNFMLDAMDKYDNKSRQFRRKNLGPQISIARSLGLYPIPEWFIKAREVTKRINPKQEENETWHWGKGGFDGNYL